MLDRSRANVPDALHAQHPVVLIRGNQGRTSLPCHGPAFPAQTDYRRVLPEFHGSDEEFAPLIIQEQPGLRDVNSPKIVLDGA